jgi:hypothetical protein
MAMATGMNWRSISRRAAGALLAATFLMSGVATSQWAAAQSAAQTVRLVVDYGDGTVKIITDLPWSKGNTVLDVMNAAKTRPHGVTFAHQGSGSSAFLTKIDDVASERGGAGKKHWQLWVNTAYADKSFALYDIQALDVVSWRFTTDQGK